MGKRYWLYKYYIGDRLVYVGQTKQTPFRRYQAHCTEDSKYEKVDFVEVAEVNNSAELNIAETAMIAELKPPWNKRWADMDIGFGVSTDALHFVRMPIGELDTVGGERQIKHNEINLFSFGGLSKYEANILSSTLLELCNSNGESVTLSIPKLKKLSEYRDSNSRFLKILERTADKLLDLKVWNSENGIEKRNIFHEYRTNKAGTEVTIAVTPEEKKLFEELRKQYLLYDHGVYLSLPNNYAKTLYRLCVQWLSRGKVNISADKFRFVMGIPNGYSSSEIDKDVIRPAIKALREILPNLKYRKIYGKRETGGGKKITAYEFTFDKKRGNNPKSAYEQEIEDARERGIAEQTVHALHLSELMGEEYLLSYMQDKEDGVPF